MSVDGSTGGFLGTIGSGPRTLRGLAGCVLLETTGLSPYDQVTLIGALGGGKLTLFVNGVNLDQFPAYGQDKFRRGSLMAVSQFLNLAGVLADKLQALPSLPRLLRLISVRYAHCVNLQSKIGGPNQSTGVTHPTHPTHPKAGVFDVFSSRPDVPGRTRACADLPAPARSCWTAGTTGRSGALFSYALSSFLAGVARWSIVMMFRLPFPEPAVPRSTWTST